MALLVNWFEIRFERRSFDLPFLEFATWEESSGLKDQNPEAEVVRVEAETGSVRSYFVAGEAPGTSTATVSVFGFHGLTARIIEYNVAGHFGAGGAEVIRGRWGVDVLRDVHRFDEIGLVLKQGINLKHFPVTDSETRHGITLKWIVRPQFERALADLPQGHSYDGYPVILRWPTKADDCPEALAPFNQHYLGTVLARKGKDCFSVLIRDRTEQDVRADALFLEARADVISALEPVITKASGQQSIQRRILQLSHSLRTDGRRNPGILRDQLRSALKIVDPSGLGEVVFPLLPNCSGRMWLNCYATGVRRE
jgi:hypothetical protein